MPFLAGQIIEADRLNMLQPKTYYAQASGALGGVVVGADVPGATVTFDTLTDNAVAVVVVQADFDLGGATLGLHSLNVNVDGVATPIFAVFAQSPGTNTDRVTASTVSRVSLGAAGSHTVKLTGSVPLAASVINVYTALNVTTYEVV